MNILRDYSDYILEIRYYIVWHLGLDKTYEERVNMKKIIELLSESSQHNTIPYSIKCRYFVKYSGIDFVEINKEIYDEIYKWQHNKKLHEIYDIRKHRDKYSNIDIENTPCNILMEEEIIDNLCEEKLKKILKKILSFNQYEIVYSLIFENKKQSEIAKEKHISKQAIRKTIICVRKKLKKFLK